MYASAVLCAFIERKQATSALLKINDENEEPKVVKPKTAPQKSVENKAPKITRQKAGGAVTLKQLEKPASRSNIFKVKHLVSANNFIGTTCCGNIILPVVAI